MRANSPAKVYLWGASTRRDSKLRKELKLALSTLIKTHSIEIIGDSVRVGSHVPQPEELIEESQITVILADGDFHHEYGDKVGAALEFRLKGGLLLHVRLRPFTDESELAKIPSLPRPRPVDRRAALHRPRKAQGEEAEEPPTEESEEPPTEEPEEPPTVVQTRPRDTAWKEVAEEIKELVRRHRLGSDQSLATAAPDLPSDDEKRTNDSARQRREDTMSKRQASPGVVVHARGRVAIGYELGGRFRLLGRASSGLIAHWHAWDTIMKKSAAVHVLDKELNAAARKAVFDRIGDFTRLPTGSFARVLVLRARAEDGHEYFVTERLETDLRQMVVREQVERRSVLPLILRVAGAVAELHKRGALKRERAPYAHGGLHPDAVLIGRNGALKISGLNPLVGAAVDVSAPSGLHARSPYAAPEMRGEPVPPEPDVVRADVYSLGMLALFALQGKDITPDGSHQPDALVAKLEESESLKNVLIKATSRNADERHSDARQFHDALARVYRKERGTPLMEMLPVPTGTFKMGAEPGTPLARRQWTPARDVTVTAFSMSKFPVTQGIYKEVMGYNPSEPPSDDNAPVNRVSFLDAVEFCNRLSVLEGCGEVYRVAGGQIHCDWGVDGYRLPTEAEWEFVARGTESLPYPWGREFAPDKICWNGPGNALKESNRKGPQSVADVDQPSPFGIQELIGNVWEWCWDWHVPYKNLPLKPLEDPIGGSGPEPVPLNIPMAGHALRILRGGSWKEHDPQWVQSAARCPDDESVRDFDIGFRIVRGAKPWITERGRPRHESRKATRVEERRKPAARR